MSSLKVLVVLLLFCVSFIKADLLPEGKKKISYRFLLTNIESYPGYTFIAYPVNSSAGAPYITANILSTELPTGLSCRFGVPVIYCIKNELFNRTQLDSINKLNDEKSKEELLAGLFKDEKFIPSIKIFCNSYVDRDEKYDVIQENFRIEEIKSDTMIIKSQKILYKDRNDNILDAKDSRMKLKDDLVSPTEKYTNYLLILIPVLALIGIVTIVVIRKMNK